VHSGGGEIRVRNRAELGPGFRIEDVDRGVLSAILQNDQRTMGVERDERGDGLSRQRDLESAFAGMRIENLDLAGHADDQLFPIAGKAGRMSGHAGQVTHEPGLRR
jgi:hypothetical protein